MNFFKRMFNANRPHDPANPKHVERVNESLRDWCIYNIDNPELGFRMVLRLRLDKPLLPQGRKFDQCITIEWPYEGAGLPDDATNAAQARFDEALEPLSEANGFSEQLFVATGNGKKEWCYYTHDREIFMREFNQALAGHDRYPIEIHFYDDPDWQVWHDKLDPIKERGA